MTWGHDQIHQNSNYTIIFQLYCNYKFYIPSIISNFYIPIIFPIITILYPERDALSPPRFSVPTFLSSHVFHMSGQTTWQITYEYLLGKMLRLRNSCLWICSVTNKQTWGTPDSVYISNSQERKSPHRKQTKKTKKKNGDDPPPPLPLDGPILAILVALGRLSGPSCLLEPSYGILMGLPLRSYGISMVCLWYFYGISMGCLREIYGILMGFLCGSYTISMLYLWYFYGDFCGIFHDMSMIFLWGSYGI